MLILLETPLDGASVLTGQQDQPQALVFSSLFVIFKSFVALNIIKNGRNSFVGVHV